MGNEALQKANDEWVGCWDQNLPDCLKTASGYFYDEKNVIPKRKKFWKIIFDVRTTPPHMQWVVHLENSIFLPYILRDSSQNAVEPLSLLFTKCFLVNILNSTRGCVP